MESSSIPSTSTSKSQSLAQPRCWSENGAFLVVGPPDSPAISPALYAQLYPCMVGCTFPVTGDPELSQLLCPNYKPTCQRPHVLVRRFGKLGYRFLFLPKHLYMLLYYIFITKKVDHNTKLALATLQGQDMAMWDEYSRRSSLTGYFTAVVDELVHGAHHLGHFNAWAMAFLCDPRRHLISSSNLRSDNINEMNLDQCLEALMSILTYAIKTPDVTPTHEAATVSSRLPWLVHVLKQIITCEIKHPAFTFLTRFGNTREGIYITEKPEDKKEPLPSSFSQSFGADIFAGAFGDAHACTLYSMDEKHTIFMVPIKIADFKECTGVAGCFWIPPYPPPCQFYAGMNELWHPRSRILVRIDPPRLFGRKIVVRQGQCVQGISEYGLPHSWNREIEPLGFLHYRDPLPDNQIVKLCLSVERYIAERSIVIMEK